MRAYLIEIVQRGNDGAPFAMPAADNVEEILDRLGVNRTERLVKQDDGRVLQEQAREQHALELSTRKRAHATLAEVLQAERVECLQHRQTAPAVETAPGCRSHAKDPWPRRRTQ